MRLLLCIVAICLLASCGTRKTQKSHEQIKAVVIDTTGVKLNTGASEIKAKKLEQHEQSNVVWNSENATLTPADPAKPMTVTDGSGRTTTFTNAMVNLGKASGTGTSDKTTVLHENSTRKDTTAALATAGRTETLERDSSSKASDRKGNPLGVGLGLGLGACLVLVFIWFVVFKRKRNEQN